MCISLRPLTNTFLLALVVSPAAHAQDPKTLRSQLQDQLGVSLTVYSNGRSMIRDKRKINLDKGQFALEIQDVSAQMRSETAQFRNTGSPADLIVLEQNLEFDLLSPKKLLEKYLGKKVSVIRTHPTNGTDSIELAEVLSVQDGPVLKIKDRIETGLPARISFPEVPGNLRAEPTLSLLVESKKRGEHEVELNYLSDGITWKADYIADLNADENRLQLTGFVTLTNQCGTSFKNAQLQLMGGDVQTVEQPAMRMMRAKQNYMAMDVASASPASMQSESFFEYHLYTLPRSTTILSNQTKQLTLLQAADVQARKEIVFSSLGDGFYGNDIEVSEGLQPESGATVDDADLGSPLKGSVYLAFENDKKSKLGMPLPAGIVRVYKRDKNSASQFLGEDSIKHVPENERVRIGLGTSFDVTARKKRTAFKNIPASSALRKTMRTVEYSNKIQFNNAKKTEQSVIFRESIPGEGKVIQSSRDHIALNQNVVEWKIVIPAQGKSVLDYTIRANIRR